MPENLHYYNTRKIGTGEKLKQVCGELILDIDEAGEVVGIEFIGFDYQTYNRILSSIRKPSTFKPENFFHVIAPEDECHENRREIDW